MYRINKTAKPTEIKCVQREEFVLVICIIQFRSVKMIHIKFKGYNKVCSVSANCSVDHSD